MRPPHALAVTLTLCLAWTACGPASAAEEWERMVVGRVGSPTLPPAVAALWAQEVADDAASLGSARPVDVEYAVFRAGDLAVVVSVVFDHHACAAVPSGSDAIHVACSGRADVVGVDRRPVPIPGACFVRVDPTWAPDADAQRSGAWASLDAETGAVRVAAVRDGQPIPGCDKTVSLR